MEIRLAKKEEIDDVILIINEAKALMRLSNIPQWQNPNYPTKEILEEDIEDGALFVMEKDNHIIGTASIFIRNDMDNEDNYQTIFEGEWLNDEPYVVIHRCAIRNSERGNNLISLFFDKAKEIALDNDINNLRIDTHEKNLSMQKAISKYNFVYCGKVYMLDNTERLAYQLSTR